MAKFNTAVGFTQFALQAGLAVSLWAGTVSAQPVPLPDAAPKMAQPDPAKGEVVAKRWCAECHAIGADQKSAAADVPAFSEIARRRSGDVADLQTFLMNPHPKMPDMQIGRDEAADLAAYILQQKP